MRSVAFDLTLMFEQGIAADEEAEQFLFILKQFLLCEFLYLRELLVCCLLLLGLVVRRHLLVRQGGTVEMSWRLGHWTFGIGRYERDRLEWFRTFSLSPRPRRSLVRGAIQVSTRRPPRHGEAWSLVPDAVVLECSTGESVVEVALPSQAVVGFLAWLEASPTRLSGSLPAPK